MDPNHLLLWMVLLSCGASLGIALKVAPKGQREWLWPCLIVIVTTVTGLGLWPAVAGYVGGVLWGLLIVLPGVGMTIVRHLLARRHYRWAAGLLPLLCALHPTRAWRQDHQLVRALAAAGRGDLDTARQRLASADLGGPRSRVMQAQRLRLQGDWEALRRWAEREADNPESLADPTFQLILLRACGETGDRNALLWHFKRWRGASAGQLMSHENQDLALLFLFSYCGQPRVTGQILSERLSHYPPDFHEYWLGVAEEEAGQGRERLQALLHDPRLDAITRDGLAQRLARPPRESGPLPLDLADQLLFDGLRQDVAELSRYGGVLQFRPSRAQITLLIIVLNTCFFGAELALGGSTSETTLFRLGALVMHREGGPALPWQETGRLTFDQAAPVQVYRHQYWRLLTASFLHFGWLHMGLNMLGLLFFGPFVERSLGRGRYLLVYLLSGFGAMAISWLTARWWLGEQPGAFLVGASGSIMGLLGASSAILWLGWLRDRAPLARRQLGLMATIIALEAAFDLATPAISLSAHFGGMLCGFLLALPLVPRHDPHATATPAVPPEADL